MTKHQVDSLLRVAAERIGVQWADEQHFPSCQEISKAKFLGKNYI